MIKGVKKAVGEFNHWNGAAIIYLDRDTGEVWTSIFADGGSWNKYEDKAIVSIHRKRTIWESNDKITMKALKEICEKEMVEYHD